MINYTSRFIVDPLRGFLIPFAETQNAHPLGERFVFGGGGVNTIVFIYYCSIRFFIVLIKPYTAIYTVIFLFH